MSDSARNDATAALIAARLNELWRTSRPTILERMTVLHAALRALAKNPAETEARSKGREAAHKLAGILGVFSLPQGSQLASEIEDLLIEHPSAAQPPTQTALSSEDLATLRSQIAELDAIIASRPAN
jgi:HPt (histidine-containing phosphotransfer) domain-containing protein